MSDLGVSGVATFSCPNCAGQCESGSVRCEHCGADLQGVETSASHTEPVELSDPAASDPGERGVLEPDPSVEDRDDDVAASVDRTSGSTGPPEWADDRPSSPARFDTEVDRFESSDPGSLREQGPLLDEDGDDIRMYTGEPVETDEGWVVPVQQNFAGKDNIAGGGEWPDPDAPPAQARPADDSDA